MANEKKFSVFKIIIIERQVKEQVQEEEKFDCASKYLKFDENLEKGLKKSQMKF